MGLSTQAATLYHHDQSTPSDTWTINHNLNTYPIVDAYVVVSGVTEKILPAAVTYVDSMTCTLTFTSAESGWATVV